MHDYLFYINEARAKDVTLMGTYCDIGQALIAQLQFRSPESRSPKSRSPDPVSTQD